LSWIYGFCKTNFHPQKTVCFKFRKILPL
jgi:hypothetical protein